MPTQVRVCSDCGEEYRADAVVCVDCGGALLDRTLDDEGNPLPVETGEAPAPPPAATLERRIVFVTARVAEVVPLAEALREAAIEYHLAEQPASVEGAPPRYALLVDEAEAGAALRALAPLIAPEESQADMQALEARFEAGRGYVACPACGAAQPPGAVECAACGLTLGAESEGAPACARCSAPLPAPGASCPACGDSPIG